MNAPELITSIQIGNDEYSFDDVTVGGKSSVDIGTLVTSIDSNSTDDQYPSAKCLYEMIYGKASDYWNSVDVWNEDEPW